MLMRCCITPKTLISTLCTNLHETQLLQDSAKFSVTIAACTKKNRLPFFVRGTWFKYQIEFNGSAGWLICLIQWRYSSDVIVCGCDLGIVLFCHCHCEMKQQQQRRPVLFTWHNVQQWTRKIMPW